MGWGVFWGCGGVAKRVILGGLRGVGGLVGFYAGFFVKTSNKGVRGPNIGVFTKMGPTQKRVFLHFSIFRVFSLFKETPAINHVHI